MVHALDETLKVQLTDILTAELKMLRAKLE